MRPGITWPRRTKSKLSMRVLPRNCVFADKGPAVFAENDDAIKLNVAMALSTSRAFYYLLQTQLAAADAKAGGAAHSFEAGVIQRTPLVTPSTDVATQLSNLARRAWSHRRNLDTVIEISHAFLLPAALRNRIGDFDPRVIETELERIQDQIDAIAFDIYGFSEADCGVAEVVATSAVEPIESEILDDDSEEDEDAAPIDLTEGLQSWAVGVGFGRFDWRLATGERAVSSEPDQFDSLPAKSPGMLPDGAEPFHPHRGILVDAPGHKHDLVRLIEDVLTRVHFPVPADVGHWLKREFFPSHLQRYSKSRRKAPIYWPLATASGGYTLWIYYPDLNSQTLYTAVNEFVEPELEQVAKDLAALRDKGKARSRDDDKVMETLQTLERELGELRDTLLQIAPIYRPSHDDGVQITAAPLWPVFRHKPWQKLLKDTWSKLEKGDHDWSCLAMAYWPGRVREKCKTDKSLAIAHGLEELYEPPPSNATGPGSRGRKRRGTAP